MINASSQHTHGGGWYLCKTEMDLELLYNNTSESGGMFFLLYYIILLSTVITNNSNSVHVVNFIGQQVMVVLAMKAGNLSGWNISVFAFLNNTDLYTGPQNDQRLFSCNLPPDDSKCPDLNISMHENTSTPIQDTSILKTITSANPANYSLKTTTLSFQATASTDGLKCQPSSSSFLFYYQEQNETARSAALQATQTRKSEKLSENCCLQQCYATQKTKDSKPDLDLKSKSIFSTSQATLDF